LIARVLVVNEGGLDLSLIERYFRESFCPVKKAKTLEEALRIIGHERIDLTVLAIDKLSCKYFADFFSILRVVEGLIPLIAVTKTIGNFDFSDWIACGVDDIVQFDVDKDDLFRRSEVLIDTKSRMCSSLVKQDAMGVQSHKRIAYFTQNREQVFDQSFLSDVYLQYAETLDRCVDYAGFDILLVDSNLRNAAEFCAMLKLDENTKNKPIVLTYNKFNKTALNLFNLRIGVTAIMDTFDNKSVNSCRINSYIKYKRHLDDFFSKVKKNIYLSSIDILTEVYNRSFFEEYISHRAYALSNSAVVVIDVDKFKSINDKFGHTFADEVLRRIAYCIKSHTRPTDVIARYGGDEFVIFMHNISSFEAHAIALRLKDKISSEKFNGIFCSVSVGICCPGKDSMNIREAINIADQSMYMAKQSGGNTVRILG